MRIMIDIPEEDYYRIASGFGQEEDALLLEKIFKNGTPIPDNATNKDTFFDVFGMDGWKRLIKSRNSAEEMNKWLNEPYQKGGKE